MPDHRSGPAHSGLTLGATKVRCLNVSASAKWSSSDRVGCSGVRTQPLTRTAVRFVNTSGLFFDNTASRLV